MSSVRLKPEPGVEYFYRHNLAWIPGVFGSHNVTPGIVVNVELKDDYYLFNFKGDETRYYCYYGWAFIKNTPENLDKYGTIKIIRKAMEIFQKDIYEIESGIEQLEIENKDEYAKKERRYDG